MNEVLTLEDLASYYLRLLNIAEAQGERINALEAELRDLRGPAHHIIGTAPWTIH